MFLRQEKEVSEKDRQERERKKRDEEDKRRADEAQKVAEEKLRLISELIYGNINWCIRILHELSFDIIVYQMSSRMALTSWSDFPITYRNASVIFQSECACLHKTVNMVVLFLNMIKIPT